MPAERPPNNSAAILEVLIESRDLLTEIRDLLLLTTGSSEENNEPIDMTKLSDIIFDTPPPTYGQEPLPDKPGWMIVNNSPVGEGINGWCCLDPQYGYDFVYPKGMVEGSAPSTIYFITPNSRAMYARFSWRVSDPFDYGPNGQKICFIFHDSAGQTFLSLGPSKHLHCLAEIYAEPRYFDPNVNVTEVTLDEWHFIEWFIDLDSGTLKYWLDGLLQGDHTGYHHPDNVGMDMFQFSPTWGGNIGAMKHEEDHYYFRQAYLSIRKF
jgi:hypothetical protein